MNTEVISYVYGAMAAGAIGNSTYDSIKYILGNSYIKLKEYIEDNDKKSFEVALEAVMDSNSEIQIQLKKIVANPSSIKMKHTGSGDNVGGNKTENHFHKDKNNEKKF